MSERQEFMRRAIELSTRSRPETGDGPFGAVVVKDGRIVGEGRNRTATAADPTAHSEIVAIRDACARLGTRDLSGCELYTSCEPCPMCVGAIFFARIDRVYYAASSEEAASAGFGDSGLRREIARPIEERPTTAGKLLGEEALAVMRAWAAATAGGEPRS